MRQEAYSIDGLLSRNSLLTLLVIAISSFPFFTTGILFSIIGFILFLFIFISEGQKIDSSFLVFIIFLSLILIGQAFIFNFLSGVSAFGVLLAFFKAYFAAKILGYSILDHFTKWIVILTIVSFVFFIPSLLFAGFEEFLKSNIAPFFQRSGSRFGYSYNPNFIIYTINSGIGSIEEGYYFLRGRNPGPFHEAGGFAVYLVPALLLNFYQKGRLVTWTNLILILGIISTQSTTGYAALGIFFILYSLQLKSKLLKLIVIPLAVFLVSFSFNNLGFISEKITQRLVKVNTENALKAQNRERFANFLVDFYDAVSYPLTGRGVNENTRYDNFEKFSGRTHKNNGVSDLAAEFGLAFFLVYFGLMFHSLKGYFQQKKINTLFPAGSLFLLILLVGFSQVIFMSFFFVTLIFLGIVKQADGKSRLDRVS